MNINTVLTKPEYKIDLVEGEPTLADSVNINIGNKELLTPVFKYNLGSSVNNPGAKVIDKSKFQAFRGVL